MTGELMDEQTLVATRRSWHGVAELVIAGPQHRAHGTIRLRPTPGGFGAVATSLRVAGAELVFDGRTAPLTGTYRALAASVGVEPGPPVGVYHDTSGISLDEPIVIDARAASLLADWLARGDAGLRAFAPAETPVLWPEHFDLAITVDEVNYGLSPGDAAHLTPYAYVGPWTPRQGAFWNASFGALRAASELPDAPAVAEFFAAGRSAAS